MKRILIIMLLILATNVMAVSRTETFSINYKIRTGNDVVNLTIDDSVYSYNCNNTYADIITRSIDRTVSFDCSGYSDSTNISNSISSLASTCNGLTSTIGRAYEDSSSYYKPYVECKASLSSCDTDLANKKGDSEAKTKCESDLKSITDAYETCKKQVADLQNTINSCEDEVKDLNQKNSNDWLWIGLAGIIGGGLVWYFGIQQKKIHTDVEKETMPKIQQRGTMPDINKYPTYTPQNPEVKQ